MWFYSTETCGNSKTCQGCHFKLLNTETEDQWLQKSRPLKGTEWVLLILQSACTPVAAYILGNYWHIVLRYSKLGVSWFFLSVKEKLAHDPDSEVATTSLRVSLLCPVSSI